MKTRYSTFGYVLFSFLLLLFSYTQVDLNLTLSQASIWQVIQRAFQHIGYYQRPFATGVYSAIVIGMFASYLLLISEIQKGMVNKKALWKCIYGVCAVLIFSYPAAFSYDFFNYLFTAKTVLVYGQNPYAVTPLQFAGIDPWTNFMRWTHLSSAYTPLWIGMSFVPFIVGLGYFVPVMFATKLMIAGFYILACRALWKLTKSVFALAVFALNPLILVETLVSGHNDIVMVAFVLLALRYNNNWLLLSFSVASKFMTIVLIPLFWLKKNVSYMLLAMLGGLVIVLLKREFLPWYWVWILPFVALSYDKPKLARASTIISFGLLMSYTPYLYFGEYSQVSQLYKSISIWSGVALGGISLFFPQSERRK